MIPARRLAALARFSRPHTVLATAVQVLGLFIVAGGHRGPFWTTLVPLATTLAACLALNVFVVGLNQLADVPIDRINKPYLPLAAGTLSRRTAEQWVLLAGMLALALGTLGGVHLLATIATIGLIGAAYSLPPLRLKNHALWAVLCVAVARGAIANVGLLWHYRWLVEGRSDLSLRLVAPEFAVSPSLDVALAAFFFAFGLVIALYKDIPDVAGDARYGVRTFTVTWGPRSVFAAGQILMVAACLGFIWCAASWSFGGDHRLALAQAGILLAFLLISWRTDPAEPVAMNRLYRVLWVLFYLEYLVLAIGVGLSPAR